jgi:hypothetical protein
VLALGTLVAVLPAGDPVLCGDGAGRTRGDLTFSWRFLLRPPTVLLVEDGEELVKKKVEELESAARCFGGR